MRLRGPRHLTLTILLMLVAFALGAAARQLLFVIDLDQPTPIPVRPVTVRIESAGHVAQTRQLLTEYLFGLPDLPADPPIDLGDGTYTVRMQNGFNSVVSYMLPDVTNGRLALYHAGHAAYGPTDQPVVNGLLSAGFAVLVFDMPLVGVNAGPLTVDLPNGPATISRHDHMGLLDPITEGSPIRYFVEPVVVMLNRFAAEYTDISMVGLSGGGWTTTVTAAIDLRIDRSYPAAGTLPLNVLLASPDNWPDWEQTDESLYALADYADLYVLGAHERRQMQVINENDPCCFGGDHRSLYLEQVQAAVASSGGGAFAVFLDTDNREHSIGPAALAAILADMGATASD